MLAEAEEQVVGGELAKGELVFHAWLQARPSLAEGAEPSCVRKELRTDVAVVRNLLEKMVLDL